MVIDFINLNGGGGGSGYTLPIASSSVLGGVKVGSGLTINTQSGVLSAEGGQGGGIEVVSQLPASGTDGQMVMLVEPQKYAYITESGSTQAINVGLHNTDEFSNKLSYRNNYTDGDLVNDLEFVYFSYYDMELHIYQTGESDYTLEYLKDGSTVDTIIMTGNTLTKDFSEYSSNSNQMTFSKTNDGLDIELASNSEFYVLAAVNDDERQTLFVYGTSPKPAIEYSKSRDGHFLDINWFDVKRVLADGDTMFDVRYFGNISYSAGTIYSKTDSGLNITPSSTVEERNDVYIQLDGDTLKFCMDRNKTISAFTLGNKAEMSGWTRVGITQEDYADGVANNDNYGKVKVKNRVDGLYIGNDGYLKSDVTVATATTGTTGVVKPSSGLNIDNQGTLTTQVQTENVGNHIVKIWLGTQAEFDQISTPDQYTVYIIKQTTTQSN